MKRIRKKKILKKINQIDEKIKKIDDRYLVALAYVWILWLVPLTYARQNKFRDHHLKQGVAIFIFSILISFLQLIPFAGRALMLFGWIVVLLLSVRGIMACLKKERWQVPVIGKELKKF